MLRPEGQASNLTHTRRSLLEHSRDKAQQATPSYYPFAVLRSSRISQKRAYTQVGPDFCGCHLGDTSGSPDSGGQGNL